MLCSCPHCGRAVKVVLRWALWPSEEEAKQLAAAARLWERREGIAKREGAKWSPGYAAGRRAKRAKREAEREWGRAASEGPKVVGRRGVRRRGGRHAKRS